MLSVYATHSISTSARETGLYNYIATLTVQGPVANYVAASNHGQLFAITCVPQAGGGYVITVRTVTPQTVSVTVLTDGTSHLQDSGYGLSIYSDSGLLQFTSSAKYPKVIDDIQITPTMSYTAQTLTFANPNNLTPWCAFGGLYHTGYFRSGNPPANISMGWPFVKFASNTTLVFQSAEVYLGGGSPFSALFANYLPIFLL